jgi:Domain of unknown function (DUF397)
MTTIANDHASDGWAGAEWRRSSACGEAGCVEVARRPGLVAVRDSKRAGVDPLVLTEAEWTAFLVGAKAGEFDLT